MPYFGVPIRNGLPIGLGSQAGFGIAPFDPRDLFSAGEQGAWYDPSDLTTLFDDSAGTTPVTAPGNGADVWVGLMLDKSKGLVLGSNILTNPGPFTTTTGWSAQVNVTLSVETGYLKSVVSSPGDSGTWQQITTVAGKWYEVSGTLKGTNRILSLDAYNGAFSTLLARSAEFPVTGSFATKTVIFQATSTVSRIIYGPKDGNPETYFAAAISVRELPGNHATSTGTKRPKLAARYNLLQRTEEFENAYWTLGGLLAFGSGSTANATIAPNGTLTADLITPNTSNSVHRILRSGGFAVFQSVTYSVYVKTNGYAKVGIRESSTSGAGAAFDISNGTIIGAVNGGGGTSSNISIIDVGNGWYQIACTVSFASAVGQTFGLNILSPSYTAGNDMQTSWTPDGTSGIYIWGADLRPASQATGLIGPTYQRVVDAATYDTAGFLPYLVADGIDDAMNTGNIVPGADKAQVFAAIRKLSDATEGVISEFSANSNTNNGAFILLPNSNGSTAAATNAFRSRGTTASGIGQFAISAAFTAPISEVVTAIGDISGDLSALRVNGSASGTNGTGDQGSGDYGNYPLYLFGRGGTSVYFNGWMYGLIIRFGPNLSTSQIESTEAYLNQKSGAY